MKIYNHLQDSYLGAHEIFSNRVSVHVDLHKFPRLYEEVLKHEIAHKEDKNLLEVLIREAKDYPRIRAMPEFREWKKLQDSRMKKGWLTVLFLISYQLIYPIMATSIWIWSGIYAFFVRNLKKDE